MSKTEKAPATGIERTRWHLPAVLLAWAVVVGSLAWSADYNRDYALSLLPPGQANSRSEWLHAGMPATLLVALVLAELAILARAHGVARVIAMTGVAFVAVTTFASSYRSILIVMTTDDPSAPDWLLGCRAAVPDVLAIAATVILVSLRQRAEAHRKTTTATETKPRAPRTPGRFARIADNIGARVETASAAKPKPAVTANAPSSAANITPVAATDHRAARTPNAEPMSWGNAADADVSAAPSAGSDRSNAVRSATPDAGSADAARSRSAENAVPTRHRDAGDPTRALAEQIRTTARMRTPVGQIAAVLRADDEQPDRPAERVADLAGIRHHSTVTRIRETRAQIEPTAPADRELARLGA